MFWFRKKKETELKTGGNLLVKELENAVCAENTSFICYKHLATLIKNGRIQNKLQNFSKKANENIRFLTADIKSIDVNYSVPKSNCKFCSTSLDNFSATGAINVGLELTKLTTKFYKGLLALTNDPVGKKKIEKVLKEKSEQKKFLEKEKQFIHKDVKSDSDFADQHCVREIASGFWK